MFLLDFDNFATVAWGEKSIYVERMLGNESLECGDLNSNEALPVLFILVRVLTGRYSKYIVNSVMFQLTSYFYRLESFLIKRLCKIKYMFLHV